MDNNQTSLLAHFIELCRCDTNQAQFYLESNNWDLDGSVAAYFADQEEEENDISEQPVASNTNQPSESGRINQISSNNSKVRMPKSNITTLASLGANRSDDDQSGDEGQAFYVGGSERGGGQEVIGPRKRADEQGGASNIIKNVFQAARDHGAEEVPADRQAQKSGQKSKSVFSGSGYRLGESVTESSDFVPGRVLAESEGPRQVPMVLKMWQNGFSIDDGSLREYSDPANREFLASISRGEIPQELLQLARGGEVELNMEDHRHEEFKLPPKPKIQVFSGSGFVLGSPAPNIVTNKPATISASEPPKSSPIVVDESQPTTQLQIRLGDGSRMVVKLNHTHTIGDIRQHIISLRPEFAARTYSLMTTFPNKSLTDDSKTLSEEKLLNAAIVQRFT